MSASAKRISGLWGWLAIGVLVLLWDLNPKTESLSRAFAPRGTHGRRGMLVVWLYLSLHLTRAVEEIDPLWYADRRKNAD